MIVTVPMEASLTNQVFKCSAGASVEPASVLLRLYGVTKGLFQREADLWSYRLVHEVGLAPTLCLTFEDGRVEEFLTEFTAIKTRDMRHPKTSRHIAESLADFHLKTVHTCHIMPPCWEVCGFQSSQLYRERDQASEMTTTMWERVKAWHDLAQEVNPLLMQKLKQHSIPDQVLQISSFHDPILKFLLQITELGGSGNKSLDCLCFCHFDLQQGNIMMDKRGEEIRFIDYEYACLATVEFDIANHWCEWCTDFDSDEPHLLKPALFPTPSQQRDFIRAYLQTMKQIVAKPPSKCAEFVAAISASSNGEGSVSVHSLPFSWKRFLEMSDGVSESVIEAMRMRVLALVPLSHYLWSLWSTVQATTSEADFNFAAYAEQRLALSSSSQDLWHKKER